MPLILRRFASFRDKVTWLATGVSALAILAVAAALLVIEYISLERETLVRLEAQSLMVALNSGAPLAFGDRASAAEALEVLQASPSVASATLFDAAGQRFASYVRASQPVPDLAPQPQGVSQHGQWLVMVQPVTDRGQALGRLQVEYDLAPQREELLRTLAFAALVLAVAITLVFGFSRRIARVLTEPISGLTHTAQRVSESRDYSLRATKRGEDELGQFTDTFNEMLAQIQQQDAEIQAAREQAEQASQLKDEFLATLSHELRTPMTPILGWAQILRRVARDNPQVVQAAEVIERNARVQTQIVDDLLDMSRIISGKIRLEVQQVDLVEVAEAALDTVSAAADARGIHLKKVMDASPLPVRGDPHRLQQVLWNLLSNAIKFTGRGGRVQLALEQLESHVEIVVSDTGQGIPADFLPHVFERFRQADSSTTRQHGGLGLGLAIVRQLVELHGGNVWAHSAGRDQGATFTVSLPLAPAVQRETPAVREHVRSSRNTGGNGEEVSLDGLTLLVVDDEPDARELVAHVLGGCGANVHIVDSAAAALRALPRLRPDVLISDIGMPEADGYQLIRAVRALPAAEGGATPAIALTAFARTEERTRALIAGYQLHVAKPVEQWELCAAVASLARLSPMQTPRM